MRSLQEAVREHDRQEEDLSTLLSTIIRVRWIKQFLAPHSMPEIMDAASGESMLLITDHYQVKDWKALSQSLATHRDIEGDRKNGWVRLMDCEDGQTRASLIINIEKGKDRISVFYRTQSYADKGRPWFEAAAGDAVRFLSRELSDPKGIMANASPQRQASPPELPDIPPEVYANLIEEAIRHAYKNWDDEPIPALNHKTPRQAIKTPAGLERVKGLLRSYEENERQQAKQEQRREISYDFLWQALGIAR